MAERLTRAERKARTRDDLAAAGYQLFLEQGFGATTLEQIAERAGVTKGAVYSNFANKEELFLEMLQRRPAPDLPDFSMFADPSRPLVERFEAFGEVNHRDHRPTREQVATWLEGLAYALRNPKARAAGAEMLRSFSEDFGRQIDERSPDLGLSPVESGMVILVTARALLDGLDIQRAFLPDLVTSEVYARATRILAAFFDAAGEDPGTTDATSDT